MVVTIISASFWNDALSSEGSKQRAKRVFRRKINEIAAPEKAREEWVLRLICEMLQRGHGSC
jgi:hypothetical protein